jgi:hypothetical protein
MTRTTKVSQLYGPLDMTAKRRLNRALSAKFNSHLTQAIDMFDATTAERERDGKAGNRPNHSRPIEVEQISDL